MTESPEIIAPATGFDPSAFRLGRTFRGEIWEDDARNEIISEFLACHFHRPIFRLANRHTTRRIGIRAANQIGKSRIGELIMKSRIKHDPGDMVLYDITAEMSDDHMKTRFMPLLRSIPEIGAIIAAIQADNRFNVTTTDIQLPGMVLRGRPLNEQWTQRITVRYGLISDAPLAEKNGQIRRAFVRSTQFEGEELWVVEGQGGVQGDDFTEFMATTDEAELWVTCPLCGTNLKFDWHRERPDDFIPVPPRSIPSLDHASWIEHHRPLLLKPEHRHAGMKRGDALVKLDDGTYNEVEIMRQTHYECFHCGGVWRDDGNHGVIRRQLDQSAHYLPTRPTAQPGHHGFSIPKWINPRISWGSCMLFYLQALRLKEQHGNLLQLQEWMTKWCGQTWDEKLARDLRRRNQEAYDVALARQDAWRLCMVVDNQKDLAQQWVMVLAVKQNSAVRQLWRGPLLGLAECRKKQLEYGVDARGNPVLKDQFVFLDGRYKPEQICQHIVENKYGHWATIGGERAWLTWNLMQGSRYDYLTHTDEKDKTKKFVTGDPNWREYKLDGKYVEVLIFPFAATACGERFEACRDGNGSETLFLERQPHEPPDDNELSHHSQIHSNKLVESRSFEPRTARMKYVPVPASAPDHYFHMWRMFEAVKEIWHIDGVYQKLPEAAAA